MQAKYAISSEDYENIQSLYNEYQTVTSIQVMERLIDAVKEGLLQDITVYELTEEAEVLRGICEKNTIQSITKPYIENNRLCYEVYYLNVENEKECKMITQKFSVELNDEYIKNPYQIYLTKLDNLKIDNLSTETYKVEFVDTNVNDGPVMM